MYLFLIRHGQSEGNVQGRLQGWQDSPLTPLGERQAVRTAMELSRFLQLAGAPVAAIYSSPLQRAARTADVIGQTLNRPVAWEPGLREMHFGRAEGLTEAEWQACFPEILPAWRDMENTEFSWPEGETRATFHNRIDTAIRALVARHAPEDNLVFVSHGGVISTYLSYLCTGEWHHWRRFPVGNCSITHVTLEPGHESSPAVACLLRLTDMAHDQDPDVAAVTSGQEE